MAVLAEFDRQLATLLERGYAGAAGLDEAGFLARLEPLRAPAASLATEADAEAGRFGFVLVPSRPLVPAAAGIGLVERRGKAGFLAMLDAQDLDRFGPIDGVSEPDAPAYLLADVSSGRESLNVTPDAAVAAQLEAGRTPLTVEEGVALATQFPEAVATNGGFSLAGSRCGDRRVVALWISGGAPKMGWCWAGNPHTWLGTASCRGRIAA